ncbi:C-type lectin domain family 4 member E-like [Latimeria chalumnae]|uniref:C-type lectin domain-containing protein n=1 Tax=Latimeria chalumnae TaxID=7897 RepID=H3AM85_LATCH|nr:PREDICTED: C-type lectin domain family 4 member E-like [Latimeria chalumnae]|eukprot:XP_006006079.2 PREDICTED: C-type lectin domain family 4 member E-like [Latimeria chalumnae]
MEAEVTYSEIRFANTKEKNRSQEVANRTLGTVGVMEEKANEKTQTLAEPKVKWVQSLTQLHWLLWILSLLCCLLLITVIILVSSSKIICLDLSLRERVMKQCNKTQHGNRWECCPAEWLLFNGGCYYFSNDTMLWKPSESNCTSMESHLVMITSKEEQDFIEKQVSTAHWIGLNVQRRAQGVSRNWKWVDGTPLNFSAAFWLKGEPNNNGGNENCATVGGWGSHAIPEWLDVPCNKNFRRICEKKALCL